MRVSYCQPCDYYQEERADRCPQCGGEMERRSFNYPDDVFGPPEKGAKRRAWPERDLDRSHGSVGAGVGLLFLLHLLQIPLGAITESGGMLVLFIGVTQLAYVIPALIVLSVKRKGATAGGVALGAGITFLLNAACFGIVCGGLS